MAPRLLAAAILALAAAGAAAQDAPPDGAALLDGLMRLEARACVFPEGPLAVLVREAADGRLEVLAPWPGAEAVREGERLVLLRGTDYLQAAEEASLAVVGGRLSEGFCADASEPLLDAVLLALGDGGGPPLASLRDHLLSRTAAAEAARVEAEASLAEAEAERDGLRAELTEARALMNALQLELARTSDARERLVIALAEVEAERDHLALWAASPGAVTASCLQDGRRTLLAVLDFAHAVEGGGIAPDALPIQAGLTAARLRMLIDRCLAQP